MGYGGHSLLLTVSQWVEIEHQALVFKYLKAGHCFEIASDAATTFNELMTRHKSTVAQFLSNHYDWFFQEYNSQLLESQNYITKRQAIKDPNKIIQLETFHVFRLFVANENKPPQFVNVLVTKRSKLLRLKVPHDLKDKEIQVKLNRERILSYMTGV
ncbi:putative MO25-like protein At5g47540 [Rosa chinensis]|uniref:putative MO25-like protein At5g47540 n=1 Tax=Rosa chinensis TaxID=74649 RepID=UPI001AD8E672|nr:putative MO25-like protein At5g47540 [Rosa chinensis]